MSTHTYDVTIGLHMTDVRIETPMDYYYNVDGNPAVITNSENENLPCRTIVSFAPSQSGNGVPAPDNMHPIIAPVSITVNHEYNNETTEATISIAHNPTVYGGTIDLSTGKLSATYGIVDLSDQRDYFSKSSSQYQPGGGHTVFNSNTVYMNTILPGRLIAPNNVSQSYYYDNNLALCTHFEQKPVDDDYFKAGTCMCISARASSANIWINVPDIIDGADVTTNANFRAWLKGQHDNGTPVLVTYPLAKPIVYRVEPYGLFSLRPGVNTIWSNDGNIKVTYYIPQTQ